MTEHTMEEYKARQAAIDRITPEMFAGYCLEGRYGEEEALKACGEALPKVMEEASDPKVKTGLWYVYNMGFIAKSENCLFSLDLSHPAAHKFADKLDFAWITHNHNDHFTAPFYQRMNNEMKKTVVSNFADNYGAHFAGSEFGGGYTHGGNDFIFRDVPLHTAASDHNDYLLDFTLTMEFTLGGLRIFHTGDSAHAEKLNPTQRPDIWIVHPRCGLDVRDGYEKFRPEVTVIAHLNEMGHARDRWRWSYEDGFEEAEKIRNLGGKAIVPLWGDRIL